jgi:two-component system, OmpR family, copper resistance phosphate regulon response regulator CusR
MKILIVEDEPKTAAYLRQGLVENGFVADFASDGEQGLTKARAGAYDLIILDVMLPRRDGWSILRELRRLGQQTPVLFLTARDAIPDRVKGLKLGADDYLVKPFAFSELLARVQSVLRRTAPQPPGTLIIADLEYDPVRRRASRAGQWLDLTPTEFSLLVFLAQRRGEVLSRMRIAEELWGVYFDDTNVVDVHVRRLRAKVDDPFEQKLIHTVRGSGYVLDVRP